MLVQILSKSLARRVGDPFDHRIQRSLGETNRPHTMVNAPGSRNETCSQETHTYPGTTVHPSPKTALDNLEERQQL